MGIIVRPVDEDEFERFHALESAVFGEPTPSAEGLAAERTVMALDRTVAAFDGDTIVGTAADYAFEMTVPGGATLPVAGVTAVTVSPTHRRRGVLRQMMAFQLDAVAARDEPMAILNASESGIYGRFGYGLAQLYQIYELDPRRAQFHSSVPARSTPFRLLSKDEAKVELPAMYDVCRFQRPGMLDHSPEWWACVLGDRAQWKGGGDIYVVVADADEVHGTGPAFALYKLIEGPPGERFTAQVFMFEAADPVVEAQLWRFLLDLDLVTRVQVEPRPLDCTLRWWFASPRDAKVVQVRDYLFVRPLDVEACLSARAYPVDDVLAVAITDPFRPATDGTYVVDGGARHCARTAGPADLAMGIDDLGAVYLGQTRPSDLAAAGRVTETTPGALARADALFGWPVAPHCDTRF